MSRRSACLLAAAAALASGAVAGASPAAAAPGVSNTYPLSIVLGNNCLGEDIIISGTGHAVSHEVTDGRGGRHVVYRATYRDVTGVGATTGTVYRISGSGGSDVRQIRPGGADETQIVSQTLRIIGPGRVTDLVQRVTYRTTTVNYVATTTHQSEVSLCR